MNRDYEPEIGAAFVKFAIVTKELSALMKTLVGQIRYSIFYEGRLFSKGCHLYRMLVPNFFFYRRMLGAKIYHLNAFKMKPIGYVGAY